MTEGVYLPDGTFLALPKRATEAFLKLWEQEVFALLLAVGKITEEVVANMRSWKHSGFSVDQSVRLEAGDTDGIQRLLQYFLRCPFSQARMIRLRQGYGGTSRGHRGGKVIYKRDDNAVDRFPEPGDEELLAGPSRNSRSAGARGGGQGLRLDPGKIRWGVLGRLDDVAGGPLAVRLRVGLGDVPAARSFRGKLIAERLEALLNAAMAGVRRVVPGMASAADVRPGRVRDARHRG